MKVMIAPIDRCKAISEEIDSLIAERRIPQEPIESLSFMKAVSDLLKVEVIDCKDKKEAIEIIKENIYISFKL